MQTSSLQRRRITGAHAFFLGALLALFALAPPILPYGALSRGATSSSSSFPSFWKRGGFCAAG